MTLGHLDHSEVPHTVAPGSCRALRRVRPQDGASGSHRTERTIAIGQRCARTCATVETSQAPCAGYQGGPAAVGPHHDPTMMEITPLDPAPRPRWLVAAREVVFVLAMFWVYFEVRKFTSAEEVQAHTNALRVVRWEKAVGLFHELSIQHFALKQHWLIWLLDHYYVMAHFPITCILLVWVFVRMHHSYRWVRAWYLIVTACGLLIHLLFPLAPPRLLDGYGFVDTLDKFGPDIYTSDVKTSTANQLAAMPSLHFAWALLVAIIVVRLWRSRWALLAFLHPFMTLFAIVATGNHYLLDAVVGATLVAIAFVARPLRTRGMLDSEPMDDNRDSPDEDRGHPDDELVERAS